jgi:general secretion pathway protein M
MQLKPVESRVVAVALALVVLVVAYFVLLHWWFVAPQLGMADDMQQLRAQEHRYAAIIAQRGELEARLAKVKQGQAASSALLADTDPSAASADLMQHAVEVAHAHQAEGPCTVTQKMPVQTATDDNSPYRKVTVNISLSCGMHALAEVLYDLEQDKPYLFIDNFSAYRSPVRSPDGRVQPLRVQFSLSGYLRRESTPAAGGKS